MGDIMWREIEPEPEAPTFGVREGAEIEVVVRTFEDGERIVQVECLCGSCYELGNVGLEDAMGIKGELEDGIHYLKSWFETYSAIPGYTSEEYDSGLAYTEEEG